jgi:hypothetical protein
MSPTKKHEKATREWMKAKDLAAVSRILKDVHEIWSVHDQKGSDPIHFTSEALAVQYAEKWLKACLGKKTYEQEVKRIDHHEEILYILGLSGEKARIAGRAGLPLFRLRPYKIYHSVKAAPKRKDYPRMVL